MLRRTTIALVAIALTAIPASAQSGYEFEVYSTSIAQRGEGELETHFNFVPTGSRLLDEEDGRATHRAFRSSIELSAGLASWLEASFYTVAYARNGAGVQYVGNRGRLTAVAPVSSRLPLRFGLTQEVGYARSGFAENRWVYEVTPIVETRFLGNAFVLNPAFERGLGDGEHEWELEPRASLSHLFGEDEKIGLEYYSVLGPVSAFDARSHQIHQIFATVGADLPGGLESAFGIGRGLTKNSDRWVLTTRFAIEF